MAFPIKEVLGAAATIAVGLLGYSQWKRAKRSGRFIEDRETAYKAVWQSLEEAHLYARRGDFLEATFDDFLLKTRTLLIQHSLHIADRDRHAAESYLLGLRQFGRMVGELEADSAARQEIGLTGEGKALSATDRAAFVAFGEARDIVVDRFRRALGAAAV